MTLRNKADVWEQALAKDQLPAKNTASWIRASVAARRLSCERIGPGVRTPCLSEALKTSAWDNNEEKYLKMASVSRIAHGHFMIIKLECIMDSKIRSVLRISTLSTTLRQKEEAVNVSIYSTFSHSSALREMNWFGGS